MKTPNTFLLHVKIGEGAPSFGPENVLLSKPSLDIQTVAIDVITIQQVQSHLLAHQYEGLLERSQLRGKSGKPRKKRSPVRR